MVNKSGVTSSVTPEPPTLRNPSALALAWLGAPPVVESARAMGSDGPFELRGSWFPIAGAAMSTSIRGDGFEIVVMQTLNVIEACKARAQHILTHEVQDVEKICDDGNPVGDDGSFVFETHLTPCESFEMYLEEFKSKFDLKPLEGIRRQCLEWDRPDPEMPEEFRSPIECYHTLTDLPACGLALADVHEKESEFWWKSIHVEYMFMSSYDSDFVKWLDAKEKYEMANDAVTDEHNDLCT